MELHLLLLNQLDWLLENLPTQLPQKDGAESCYQAFLSFSLDPDILEKMGDEVATLGEHLTGIGRVTGGSRQLFTMFKLMLLTSGH
jgi:hypothetical protein